MSYVNHTAICSKIPCVYITPKAITKSSVFRLDRPFLHISIECQVRTSSPRYILVRPRALDDTSIDRLFVTAQLVTNADEKGFAGSTWPALPGFG